MTIFCKRYRTEIVFFFLVEIQCEVDDHDFGVFMLTCCAEYDLCSCRYMIEILHITTHLFKLTKKKEKEKRSRIYKVQNYLKPTFPILESSVLVRKIFKHFRFLFYLCTFNFMWKLPIWYDMSLRHINWS